MLLRKNFDVNAEHSCGLWGARHVVGGGGYGCAMIRRNEERQTDE
jgi:hypothetical protein